MLPPGMWQRIGSAFWRARRARDPKRIAAAQRDIPEAVLSAAKRQGIVWRLDAHPVDCVEDPKLIIACIAVRLLDLSHEENPAQQAKLRDELKSMFGGSGSEIEELITYLRWLGSQLGGPESKTWSMAKRLDEIADTGGFLDLMEVLKTLLNEGWNEAQTSALKEIKRVFRIF